jgi:hypothetical protein
MQTILVSFTSPFGMYLFITLPNGDAFIYHLATVRAKADRRVCAAVIKARAFNSLCYHLYLLSIHDYDLSRSLTILLSSSLSPNRIMTNGGFPGYFHRR